MKTTYSIFLLCLLYPFFSLAQTVDLPEMPEEEPELDEIFDQQEVSARETFVMVDKEPVVLNYDSVAYKIGYPMIMRDAGVQGDVVVRVLVDTSGQYVEHKVLESVHPLLQKAVEEHIHELEFEPASYKGTPTAFWVNVPFKFRLLGYRERKTWRKKKRD